MEQTMEQTREQPKAKKDIKEKNMDKTLADSFPASDPPSSIPDPEDEPSKVKPSTGPIEKENPMKKTATTPFTGNRAEPFLNQRGKEIQRYGTLVQVPIGLDENVRLESVKNLN